MLKLTFLSHENCYVNFMVFLGRELVLSDSISQLRLNIHLISIASNVFSTERYMMPILPSIGNC